MQFSTRGKVSAKGAGGWLYCISDCSSTRQYWGLTRTSVEIRFHRHQHDAKRGVAGRLYDAMRERPEDFSVQSIAFFFTQSALAAAEKEMIAESKSLWPNGYNASIGGQTGPSIASHTIQTALRGCTNPEELAAMYDYRTQMAKQGLSLQIIRRRVRAGQGLLQALSTPALNRKPRPFAVNGRGYASIGEARRVLGIPASVVTRAHETKTDFAAVFESYCRLTDWFSPTKLFAGHKVKSWKDAYSETGFGIVSLTIEMARMGLQDPEAAMISIATRKGVRVGAKLYANTARACDAIGVEARRLPTLQRGKKLSRQQAFDVLLKKTTSAIAHPAGHK